MRTANINGMDYIITGSHDSTCKIWNFDGKCLSTMLANDKNEWLSFSKEDNKINKMKMSPLGWRLGNFVDENKNSYFPDEMVACEVII